MTVGAILLCLSFGATPASARQTVCDSSADFRERPACFNQPGSTLAPRTVSGDNRGATTQPGERVACPRTDGGPNAYESTVWVAFHPHTAGILVVQVRGVDAQLVLEEGAGPPSPGRDFVCSDDSDDRDIHEEHLVVGGLKAGQTYLLQIGSLTRFGGSVLGDFELTAGLLPDRDGDGVPDTDDPCPDAPAGGNGCPGGGSGPGPGPGIAPNPVPDPDSDGIQGAADHCPAQPRGRDANRDGCPDKPRQTIEVTWRIQPTRGRGVIVRELRTRKAGRGTRVSVRCSRGCRGTSFEPRRSRTRVRARRLHVRRLRPGATIDVIVRRKGYNGEIHRFVVRRRTMESLWTRCLPEGARRPVKGECF